MHEHCTMDPEQCPGHGALQVRIKSLEKRQEITDKFFSPEGEFVKSIKTISKIKTQNGYIILLLSFFCSGIIGGIVARAFNLI